MNVSQIVFLVVLAGVACTLKVQAQEKKIEMTRVKYAGLKEEVLKQRGKVVVVDFWAGY